MKPLSAASNYKNREGRTTAARKPKHRRSPTSAASLRRKVAGKLKALADSGN